MNLLPIYLNHPEFAEIALGPRVHLVKCADCPHRFPPDQLYAGEDELLCATCFDRRNDMAWQDWHERLAKESRGER